MSTDYYLSRGYTPQTRYQRFDATDTLSIWTPTTSTRVVITGISIAANIAGTFLITWGNLAGSRVAEFVSSGSTTITPRIGVWEGTMYDRSLFGRPSTSPTDGWKITLDGFEIPQT